MEEPADWPFATNWTQDANKVENSSPLFLSIVDEVEQIVRDGAASIVAGRSDVVARTIVARLAHVRGLVPKEWP